MWASLLAVPVLIGPMLFTFGGAVYINHHHEHYGSDAAADMVSIASSTWSESMSNPTSGTLRQKRQGGGLTEPVTHCVGLMDGNAQCIAGTKTWIQTPGGEQSEPTIVAVPRQVEVDANFE